MITSHWELIKKWAWCKHFRFSITFCVPFCGVSGVFYKHLPKALSQERAVCTVEYRVFLFHVSVTVNLLHFIARKSEIAQMKLSDKIITVTLIIITIIIIIIIIEYLYRDATPKRIKQYYRTSKAGRKR